MISFRARIDVPCREINCDRLGTIDGPLFRTATMAYSEKKSVEVISSSDDEGFDELNMKNPDEEEDQNLHLPAPFLTPLTPPATTKKQKRGQKEKEKSKQDYLHSIQCLIHLF